jgi:hypothetical protein
MVVFFIYLTFNIVFLSAFADSFIRGWNFFFCWMLYIILFIYLFLFQFYCGCLNFISIWCYLGCTY